MFGRKVWALSTGTITKTILCKNLGSVSGSQVVCEFQQTNPLDDLNPSYTIEAQLNTLKQIFAPDTCTLIH
jgi:hypothetical protein